MAGTDTTLVRRAEVHRPAQRTDAFRPDIEGMRAVAVGLVLLYHAGIRVVPGGFVGVDVFFVISGFLITGLLVRELERTGRVSLPRFYARRAKRLLPATALVLVTTTLLTWWLVPVTSWRDVGGDVVAAAAYVVNWRLADRSVDYLAEGTGASPVQHFWSLAVEEQYYVVWPLLLVAVGWWVRHRRGARVRPVMGVALAFIVVPSLLWSVHLSRTAPEQAFFVTTTRLWELGIGAAVAIAAPLWDRVPRVAAVVVGWLGLAAVTASALLLGAGTTWPGYAALLPTLGTAAVIAAGSAAGPAGPTALLSLRPMVWLGAMSYSLYLWHWPLVVLATEVLGELGQRRGLAVVVLSVVPAWLSLKLLENPVRFAEPLSRSNGLALSVGANCTLVGALAGVALLLAVPPPATAPRPPVVGEQDRFGAALVTADPEAARDLWREDTTESLVPAPVDAVDDLPDAYDDECQAPETATRVRVCEFGDRGGDLTLGLVGDSKALQWQTALDAVGQAEGWRVLTLTKSACALAAGDMVIAGGPYPECEEWNRSVVDEAVERGVDVVVVSHGADIGNASVDGVVTQWRALQDAGIGVVVLLDNPTPIDVGQVYECVAENPETLSACSFDRAAAVAESGATLQRAALEQVPDVPVVDLTDVICPGERCPAVIGDVLVYRQGSHLTRTFVDTAATALAEALVPAVEEARR